MDYEEPSYPHAVALERNQPSAYPTRPRAEQNVRSALPCVAKDGGIYPSNSYGGMTIQAASAVKVPGMR